MSAIWASLVVHLISVYILVKKKNNKEDQKQLEDQIKEIDL